MIAIAFFFTTLITLSLQTCLTQVPQCATACQQLFTDPCALAQCNLGCIADAQLQAPCGSSELATCQAIANCPCTAPTQCRTIDFSLNGQICEDGCVSMADPCARNQCLLTCALNEGNANCQRTSSTQCNNVTSCACSPAALGVTAASYVAPAATTYYAPVANGCSSAAQAQQFHQCCFGANSACAAASNATLATACVEACACAATVQQCQQQFAPCQNPSLGSSAYQSTVCAAPASCSSQAAFSQCCQAPQSPCATIAAQYPTSGAPATLQCGCAQQTASCQRQYPGCSNPTFGSPSYLNSVCAAASNNNVGQTLSVTTIAEIAGGGGGGLLLLVGVVVLAVCLARRRSRRSAPAAAEPSKAGVAENNPLFDAGAGAKENPIFYETQSSLPPPSGAAAAAGPSERSMLGTQSQFGTIDFAKQDPKAALYPNLEEQVLPSQPGRANDALMLSARDDGRARNAPALFGDVEDPRSSQYTAPFATEDGGRGSLYPGVQKI